jgi:hypothetical protein
MPSREDRVWNYRAIARDVVVNLESLPRDVKIEELANLAKLLRHKAEIELLNKLDLKDHPLAREAQAGLDAAKMKIAFHNHALLDEDDIAF